VAATPDDAARDDDVSLALHHPTRMLAPDHVTAMTAHWLGGPSTTLCDVCQEPANHLLTLSPVPDGLGVTGLTTLELLTCHSCLSGEIGMLVCQHDAVSGRARPINSGHVRRWSGVESGPALAAPVALLDHGPRWRWQRWGDGNMDRVGGHPTWIQQAEYPPCPRCGQPAHFLLQIDSGLPRDPAYPVEWVSEWYWGSGGLLYVFWCDRCRVSLQYVQDT
jgi:hypothetical protein